MKIIIFGSSGQLGQELSEKLEKIFDVRSFSRKEVDITNFESVKNILEIINPDIIINAAAYTQVDKSETNKDYTFQVNYAAVDNLASLANKLDSVLIHFSTDYVFDGKKKIPYLENDLTSPINVYGSSKLEGEKAILKSNCKYYIFRTTWVYSQKGKNFIRTIKRLCADKKKLEIVNDQFGVPTSTSLITSIIIKLINSTKQNNIWDYGIYNLVPSGLTNWYEMAKLIIKIASQDLGLESFKDIEVKGVPSSKYICPAKRPLNSQLNNKKLQSKLNFQLPNWQEEFITISSKIIRD